MSWSPVIVFTGPLAIIILLYQLLRSSRTARVLAGVWLFAAMFAAAGSMIYSTRPQPIASPALTTLEVANAAPVPSPAPISPAPTHENLSAFLDEVDGLYEELLTEHATFVELQTDPWDRRWARDAYTLEQYEQRRLVGRLRQDLERSQDGDLGGVKRRIELRKQGVERRLVKIREEIGNAQEGPKTTR